MSKKKRAGQATPDVAPTPAPQPTSTALHWLLPHWFLPLLVAAYVVLTLLLIIRVPLGQVPDEGAHLDYVAYLAEHGKPPVFNFKKVKAPEYGYEFHQPPLYYALCTPLWKLAGEPMRKYLCRYVSMVCGALTLLLLWHSVLALFPSNNLLAGLTTGFAALWPMHQGVGAAGSNDALAGLCCAGILWAVARGARRPWQRTDSILVGVFFGLGMLSKSSSLTIGLAGVGAAWALAARNNGDTDTAEQSAPSPLVAALAVIGVTAAISGWWLARNQVLYGDPLAAGVFDQAFRDSSPGPSDFFAGGVPVATYLRALFLILFCTNWGVFGGPDTANKMLNPFGSGPHPAAIWALPFMLICAAATVVALLGLLRRARTDSDVSPPARVALVWWGVGTLLVVLVLVRFNFNFYQAQARYLHPALLPIALAFGLGWQHWLTGTRPRLAWAGLTLFDVSLLFLTLWNVFGWRTLV